MNETNSKSRAGLAAKQLPKQVARYYKSDIGVVDAVTFYEIEIEENGRLQGCIEVDLTNDMTDKWEWLPNGLFYNWKLVETFKTGE